MKPIHIGIVLVIALVFLYFCYQKQYTEHFRSSSLDVFYDNQSNKNSQISMNQCGKMVLPGGLNSTPETKIEVIKAEYFIDTKYSGKDYCDNSPADPKKEINVIQSITDKVDRTVQVSRSINYSLNNGGTLENIQCSSQFSDKCFPPEKQTFDSNNKGIIDSSGSCYFWNDPVYGFGPQIAPFFKSKQTMEITYLMNGITNKLKLRYGQPVNLRSSPEARLPTLNTDPAKGELAYTRYENTYPSKLYFFFDSYMNEIDSGSANAAPSNTYSGFPVFGLAKTNPSDANAVQFNISHVMKTNLDHVENKSVGVYVVPLTTFLINKLHSLDPADTDDNKIIEKYLKEIAYASLFVPTMISGNNIPEITLNEFENYMGRFPEDTYFFMFPIGFAWNDQYSKIAEKLPMTNNTNNSMKNLDMISNYVFGTPAKNNQTTGNFLEVSQYNATSKNKTRKFLNGVSIQTNNQYGLNVSSGNSRDSDSNTNPGTSEAENYVENIKYSSNIKSACMPYFYETDTRNTNFWPEGPNTSTGSSNVDYGDPNNKFTSTCMKFSNCNEVTNLTALLGHQNTTTDVTILCKKLDKAINFRRYGHNQSYITLTDKETYNKLKKDKNDNPNTAYINSFVWTIEPVGNIYKDGSITRSDIRGLCYIYSKRKDAVGQEVRNYLTANPDDTVSINIYENTNNSSSIILSSKHQWLLCDDDDNANQDYHYIRSRSNNKYLSYKNNGGYPSGPSIFLENVANTSWKLNTTTPDITFESFTGDYTIDCSKGVLPIKTTAKDDTPASSTTNRSNWNPCFASYWNGKYIYQDTDPNSKNPKYISINLSEGKNNNKGTVSIPSVSINNKQYTDLSLQVMALSSSRLIPENINSYPQIFLNMIPFDNVQLNGTSAPQNLIKLSGQLYLSEKPNDVIYIPGGQNPNMFMIKRAIASLLVNQSYLAAKGIQFGTYPSEIPVEDVKYVVVENNNPQNCGCDKYCAFNIDNKVSRKYKARNWKGSKAVAQSYRDKSGVLHLQDVGKPVSSEYKKINCYCEEDDTMPYLSDCKNCKDLTLPTGNSPQDILDANKKNCSVKIAAVSNITKMISSPGSGSISSFFVKNPQYVNGKWVDADGGMEGNMTLFSFNGYLSNIALIKDNMTAVNIYKTPYGTRATSGNIGVSSNVPEPTFSEYNTFSNLPHYFSNTARYNARKFSVYLQLDLTNVNPSQYGIFGKDGYHFGIQTAVTSNGTWCIFPYAAAAPGQYPRINGRPASFDRFASEIGQNSPSLIKGTKTTILASWNFKNNGSCEMAITSYSASRGRSYENTYTTTNVPYYPYDTNTDYNIGVQASGSCDCNVFPGKISNVMFFNNKYFNSGQAYNIVSSQNTGYFSLGTLYLYNKITSDQSLKPITIVNSKRIDGHSFIYPGTEIEFKLKMSCNSGSYPQVNDSKGNVESCCRGPYPSYYKRDGQNVTVANNEYKENEVVRDCASGLSSSVENQGTGIGDLKNYTFETYYVSPINGSWVGNSGVFYTFSGPYSSSNFSITPYMSSKIATALMSKVATTDDCNAANNSGQINIDRPGWFLSGNLQGSEMKYGYMRSQGEPYKKQYPECPDSWSSRNFMTYDEWGFPTGLQRGCFNEGSNAGTCDNPSFFNGYTDSMKANWAGSCDTKWTSHWPKVSLNNPSKNKFKGFHKSDTTYFKENNSAKADLFVVGMMPIYVPELIAPLYATSLKPIATNPDSNNKNYWKEGNCYYSQYALLEYDNINNPQKIVNNRSMYTRYCD